MSRGIPSLLTLGAACAWLALLWHSGRDPGTLSPRAKALPRPEAEKHYVSPNQLVASGEMAGRGIEPISAMADDGPFDWPGRGGSRPLVLVFIKRNCPCNVEFEPFFHRLEARYRDVADFAGVIDGDVGVARAYATANAPPYRVLADPGGDLIARLEARNGGYVALLRPSGEVDTLWPGLSAEMMRELGRRIADLASSAERPLDVAGMPKVLTTGCPYSS